MLNSNSLLASYGPCAMITGASDGIGKEFARTLASIGFDLILVARRVDRLEDLSSELSRRYKTRCRVIEADLEKNDQISHVLALTQNADIGLFVASAGFGTSGSFLDTPLADESGMLDVNCRAVLSMSHSLAARFVERGRGGIVFLSSIVAFQGVPRSANYAATKAYIQSLAEGLHVELKPLGVDVIAAAPGPINSGFSERAGMDMGSAQDPADVPGATLRALGKQVTVRPGVLSKLLGYSLNTLPRWGRVKAMTAIMGGMTKHQ